jgi:starvation-inducible outer membrane lipoprotein
MKLLIFVCTLAIFLSGCTAWSIKPQTGELSVISICKDVDVNDLYFDGKTWRIGSVSSHTSGLTEGIIGAAAAIVVLAP